MIICFTFEGEELGLAMVSLTVEGILDYQLVLFKVPDANTFILGVDSDAIEIPEPEPEPDTEAEQIDLQFPYDSNIVPYAQKKEQEKEESLKCCPSDQGLIPVTEELSAKESKGRELPLGGGYGGTMMGGRGVIDISSDITSNQVWTADNTYHIIADVNVQALLVIEPGTVVEFAADKVMFVNNGGTLISVGTPNDPVVYTSDSGTPGYDDYYCPMYIEETASANTKVMYSYVEYAYVGLLILNNKLETDIQNNYFYNNEYGIVEFGKKHTNVRNNLLVSSYYSGIEVFLGDSTGEGSADSTILIEDNTCDYYQDNGITVHGVEDVNEAGVVVLANNIVSGSYQYGLALVDDYMYAIVTNIGYFDNADNKNWAFDEDNPAFETVLPYETGTGTLPVCYLRQDCNFINTGSFLIEQTPLIGQTTDVNSIPDYNYVDIGFHYPNWNFSNPGSGDSLSADFDDSMGVDFKDYATFANYWQQSTSSDADLDESGFVDYNDLSIFTNQWLQIADPNIEINIYGDSSDGFVDIGVSGFTSDTQRIFLLINGEYVGEVFLFEDGETLEVDISDLGAGTHQLKAVSISTAGRVTCSNIKDSTFTCFLNHCFCADAYDSNEPHYFCAYYSGPNDVSVKVYDEDNSIVWSQTY
ncbi:MAG: right-handed parallel beta-helix repeat-containing protein [Sedimentisphaerales bacterium]|nr:right-handed parallel beta-helix repeat-containing protein [Sedimentisphaerales bacterium]